MINDTAIRTQLHADLLDRADDLVAQNAGRRVVPAPLPRVYVGAAYSAHGGPH